MNPILAYLIATQQESTSMSLTHERVRDEAQAVFNATTDLLAALVKVEHILDHNSALAIDWSADPKPDYIEEDADGNISGLGFSRQEVSNAVGSLNAIRTLLEGGTPATGDHDGVLFRVSKPMPLRR